MLFSERGRQGTAWCEWIQNTGRIRLHRDGPPYRPLTGLRCQKQGDRDAKGTIEKGVSRVGVAMPGLAAL
ncbi:hypothetical protein SKAU_G00080130 [Synaphobranchus kaupii]|uniref:Uncharacterized protein n=1 Tax=Synaphobranchus kaupii TaxID=118154 RepID=A0A9Q1FUP6_SYNKA|nr:hypothetical protein SKAU_G00080130 [Synaphobranchus kaupii]